MATYFTIPSVTIVCGSCTPLNVENTACRSETLKIRKGYKRSYNVLQVSLLM